MLKELLGKIFKKKKKITKTKEIISILDAINIPPKEYLQDEELLGLIDKYEDEYIEMLNSKKHIVHADFNLSSLKDEMSMNVDLVLNFFLGNSFQIYGPEKTTDIDILKLEIYRSEFKRLEYETLARIVTLKEIEKALSKSRRNRYNKLERVQNEINSLTSMFIIFESQKRSIEIEVETYINTHEENKLDKEETLIKLEQVESLAREVIPKRLEILKSVSNVKVRIALIERELEIYVHENKERLALINSLLDKIFDEDDRIFIHDYIGDSSLYDNKIIRRMRSEDSYSLDIAKKFENEVLTFALYGRNLISEEKLKGLYRYKFYLLTKYIITKRNSPIDDKTNNFELECYKEIVMKNIERVITKKAKIFKNFDFFEARSYIKYFKEIVTNDNGQYDSLEILKKPKILAFILAFNCDHPSDFYSFFRNYKVPKEEYDIDYFEDILKWKDELPLATIFRLMSVQKNSKYDPLERIYNQLIGKRVTEEKEYTFPEGLVEIAQNCIAERKSDITYISDNYILNILGEKVLGKEVIMPNSLEVEFCPLIRAYATRIKYPYNYLVYSDIERSSLKRGREAFTYKNRTNFCYEIVLVPTIMDAIPLTQYISSEVTRQIGFYDFENSKILNDEESLKIVLKHLFFGYGRPKLEKITFYDKDFYPVLEIDKVYLKQLCEEVSKYSPGFNEEWKNEYFFTRIMQKVEEAKKASKSL